MYESSQELGELFQALSKAQLDIKDAPLDKVNPFHKSKYASLKSCRNAYKDALAKHSLALVQQVFTSENNYFIRSVLGHSSGQWIANTFKLLINKNDMQGLGSAITYGRRYGACALIGVVDTEDDDANSVMMPVSQPVNKKPIPAKPVTQNSKVSVAQLKGLNSLMDINSWSSTELSELCIKEWNIKKSTDLNNKQFAELKEIITTMSFNEYMSVNKEAEMDDLDKALQEF